MHDFPWMWWFMFGMFFWMFFIRPRRLGLCEGRSRGDELRERGEPPPRRASRSHLESALAERDALIAQLEERVRVLERIATDPSARLREEIERLRDTPPGSS